MRARGMHVITVVALLAIPALGGCSSGAASADEPLSVAVPAAGVVEPEAPSGDSVFLSAIAGRVTSVGTAAAQGMGQRVCSAFAEGTKVLDIRNVLIQKGLEPAEASMIIMAAVSSYCPEWGDKAMG